jgi:hypothetical protein
MDAMDAMDPMDAMDSLSALGALDAMDYGPHGRCGGHVICGLYERNLFYERSGRVEHYGLWASRTFTESMDAMDRYGLYGRCGHNRFIGLYSVHEIHSVQRVHTPQDCLAPKARCTCQSSKWWSTWIS